VRAFPALYKWRVRLVIYRRYRALISLERESMTKMTPEQRAEMLTRLDAIENAVNKMRVPASFADQFYSLRGHIDFVRERLAGASTPPTAAAH
jgi:hypothetical protein